MSDALKLPRTDIQALRGLAVLMVVLYHTKIGGLDAGYLGVDVFFVISGFLITTLVASGINKGAFGLGSFYFRRAKRLLPAAYITFLITALLAPWFLNQQELKDFATQVGGAVTFMGNFVLWQQTGYFEGAGDLKPLLHVWSLAIEEQYYFLLPPILLITRPSRWFRGTVALLVVSLGLCILGGIWKPIATFYLLPTRAWELLIGSLGALWTLRDRPYGSRTVSSILRLLFLPSLICLFVLPLFPFQSTHPGLNAVLMCISTLVVILRKSTQLNTAYPTKILARIGDFSYSLYLVHWPIIAFVKNAWVGSTQDPPLDIRLFSLILSFGLAYMLYRFVEDPVRRSSFKYSTGLIGKVVMSSFILIAITPVAMSSMTAKIDFKEVRQTNFGFSESCEYTGLFVSKEECKNNASPSLLVWGDSYAMHLIPGLAKNWKPEGVMQATRSQCGPFLDLAPRQIVKPVLGPYIDQSWAERCISFNQSVIDFLRTNKSIEFVVLSSPFSQYFTYENYEHVVKSETLFKSVPVNRNAALASLRGTVDAIRAMGKKIVLVAPPPSSGFDVGGCLERQIAGKLSFGGNKDCAIDKAAYFLERAELFDFLNSIALDADVSIIRFDPWLCDERNCKTFINETMIYRDRGHLSRVGSELLAERMYFANLIREQAR